jgi:hypothetical protein
MSNPVSPPRREPVTAEDRVSYVDARGKLLVFDQPVSCALCKNCLGHPSGLCLYNWFGTRAYARFEKIS